jgi:hypothetical protein
MIINIRGTNGAGKSHIVKTLFWKYSFSLIGDNTYYSKELNLFIIGKYHNNKMELIPTGGCDQLSANEVVDLVVFHKDHNVLFEGASESTSYNKWNSLAKSLGFHNFIFLFLDTSVEECIKLRAERRCGDTSSDHGNGVLIKNHARCGELRKKFRENGHAVYHVNKNDAIEFIECSLNKKDYRDWLIELSGSGKRIKTKRNHGLYCSINLPLFRDMKAVRDIKERFADFGIEHLEGDVLDYGSNCGSLIFEAMNYGCGSGKGYEYHPLRVLFCNKIAEYYKLDLKFYQYDFNNGE